MKHGLITLTGFMVAVGIAAVAQEASVRTPAVTDSSVTSAPAAAAAPGFQERHPRYRLRKGDSFELDFSMTPDFNQTITVQPDGYITLKAVGSVFIEGQNVPELTETLKTAYAKVLHEPVIAISLKDFEKPYFIASGQVNRPGKYDLRSDLTVTEAVAIAGGFDEKSKHSQVVLFHPMPGGGFQAKLINVKKLLATHDLTEDVQMQPGDMLYVPQNTLSKIRPFLPNSSVTALLGSGGVL
jgi:protein involved in polysaccharide export with SLBB domain